MIRKRSLIRRGAAGAAAGTAAAVLDACGGSGDSTTGHNGHTATSASASASASQGQPNAADIAFAFAFTFAFAFAFAQGMIPHHRQAVEMTDLAPSRAKPAEVKKLTEQIKKAQDPEIKTLSGRLTSWASRCPPRAPWTTPLTARAG